MSRPTPPNRTGMATPSSPAPATGGGGGGGGADVQSPTAESSSAVPTLRVMRLQSPELHIPSAGGLDGQYLLHNALCLPDSLEVLVGETFTAYLGVLNVSRHVTIRRLSVSAHLQTPSQRWQLPSPLEASAGVDVPVGSAVDTIVSHAIEEAGQHILRVEVSYSSLEGGTKTFRKFYRFQVVNPLTISALTVRSGENSCLVSISVEYTLRKSAAAAATATPGNNSSTNNNKNPIVVSEATFLPIDGITAKRIGKDSPFLLPNEGGGENSDTDTQQQQRPRMTAAQLLDASGCLFPGSVVRYLFQVSADEQKLSLRGIAAGDKLGTALFTWRKSMGETGRIASSVITCPATSYLSQRNTTTVTTTTTTTTTAIPDSFNNFVVHRSGLSVDVAAAAANRGRNPNNRSNLSILLPVTVEPIHPPSRMKCNIPMAVKFYIVNHSDKAKTLQLQFRLSNMSELAICGPSFVSLGTVAAEGGSTVVEMRFLPLATGLLRLQGCWIVDLASDQEIAQPPLFDVFVEKETDDDDDDDVNPIVVGTQTVSI